MKISLLLEREPFDKIFEKTFSNFLSDYTNYSHNVKWYPKKHNKQYTTSGQKWYCNPLINSIFVKGAKPAVFDSISREYSHNPLRPMRSLIQKLYLSFSKNKLMAPLMAKYVIEIFPPIEDAKNKLIIGGNTKIRIIDVTNKKVFVILKEGFDKKYLERELYVREKFTYIPIPKIQEYGSNSLWYCEDYVSGVSPDRMHGKMSKDVLWDAIEYVHKMLNETKKNEPLSKYVGSLFTKIVENVDQISILNKKMKTKIKDSASTLATHLNRYNNDSITTAYCHGDFQEGNIICDGEKTWILDWEYSGRKQIGYDLFVLLLKSRVYKGFPIRFIRLMNNGIASNQMALINRWPEIDWGKKSNIKIYLLLFLLEELYFHLEENISTSFYELSRGLTALNKNIALIHNNLQNSNI